MEEYSKGFNTALRFLSRRLKTEAEVRDKLRSSCSEELTERILEKLKELGYIDDDYFVSCYIRDRMKFNPMGRYRIKKELYQKGVNKDLVDNNTEFVNIDEVSVITGLLNRKFKKPDPMDESDLRKIEGYLKRRGFELESINKVLKP
jgi:regulatory protein